MFVQIIEKFGLYRSVDRGNKHRCQTGYHMTGSPFVVCSHLGSWNVMFESSLLFLVKYDTNLIQSMHF
jgi:hypothetical protein